MLIGALAQIRGLTGEVQNKTVALLRHICGLVRSTSLDILPGVSLDIDESSAFSMLPFLEQLLPRSRSLLKTRWHEDQKPILERLHKH